VFERLVGEAVDLYLRVPARHLPRAPEVMVRFVSRYPHQRLVGGITDNINSRKSSE
jgi:hypothetical protein